MPLPPCPLLAASSVENSQFPPIPGLKFLPKRCIVATSGLFEASLGTWFGQQFLPFFDERLLSGVRCIVAFTGSSLLSGEDMREFMYPGEVTVEGGAPAGELTGGGSIDGNAIVGTDSLATVATKAGHTANAVAEITVNDLAAILKPAENIISGSAPTGEGQGDNKFDNTNPKQDTRRRIFRGQKTGTDGNKSTA